MSAVDDAQDELLALLQADDDFSGVLTRAGIPFELPRASERVYVSEDVTGYRRSRSASDYTVESFGLLVVVEVWRAGEAAGPAKARTWELIDALDALLERHDFYGYGSEDGELQAELGVAAYDKGRLVKTVLTIPVVGLS